ncbi:YggT family protein [Bacillus sp. RG28]|uniref:YggT family protein n=1 Tax=Gottfriedia endophytica TaxID=2820819 RepID=A0A940NU05_9BACI|nr:YggT family protein [Gottfriedia endophytica]MBP0724828.1 YggT family protein [Gottfriedia endophytica]
MILFQILSDALVAYQTIIIINIILSWFPSVRDTGFGRFINAISEPYLEPFRRIIPTIGMFDFSPIVAIFALQFAQYGLFSLARYLM